MGIKARKKIDLSPEFALEWTQSIIDITGPRLVGSNSCLKAADLIYDELTTFSDHAFSQEFEVHPKAFLGWIKVLAMIYFFDLVALWLGYPWIAVILTTLGFFIMYKQFVLYEEFIDRLWKKKKGKNVWGIIEPEGEIKQQIIVSGHHDSSFVFNFFVHQPKLYPVRIYGGLGSLLIALLFGTGWGIFLIFNSSITPIIQGFRIFLTVMLILVPQLWFFRGKVGTPGAGDNLISTAIAIQIGQFFGQLKRNNKGLKHTRLIIASWDGEEAGLRGSRAYCRENFNELRSLPSYNFNLDCPYFLDELFFLTTDVNGTVKLSETMARECQKIAHDLYYKAELKPIAFLTGGTDAGEFGRIGVEATNLMAMPWGNSDRASFYHTLEDKVDKIEPQVVKASLEIISRYILQKENEIDKNQ